MTPERTASTIRPTGDLDRAAQVLRQGGLVAVPTETVYGLAGDARSGEAVARIFEVKGRPAFNPLIAHVATLAMADRLTRLSSEAERLADAFWPGPLTLVLPMRVDASVHPLVTAGLPSLAIRWPRGAMAELSRMIDAPLAAPSANRSGSVSPTRAEHVLESLGDRLDGGRDTVLERGEDAEVGVESTIVSLLDDRPTLLRSGGLEREAVEQVLGMSLLSPPASAPDGERPAAPGMLASHYAPRGTVRLDAARVEPHEFLIGFGPVRAAGSPSGSYVLSERADLREAARRLFDALHAANAAGAEAIAVEPVPHEGLGEAINDRLRRAAAPRER